MADDYRNSTAQYAVDFITAITRTSFVGQNYATLGIFIEDDRFISDPTLLIDKTFEGVTYKEGIVTKDNYAQSTNGLLKSWLYDFFCNNTASQCYLWGLGVQLTAPGDWSTMELHFVETYNIVKALAYHKTILVSADGAAVLPDAAHDAAAIFQDDFNLLSSPPYLPYTTATPTDTTTDPLYNALAADNLRGIFTAYQDTARNGALFSLGLAMAQVNTSGTPVGEDFDYIATNLIQSSGANGLDQSLTVQTYLKNNHIQFFRPVGDGTGNVNAVGSVTTMNDEIGAQWILCYLTFTIKAYVANYITRRGVLRDTTSYSIVLGIMYKQLKMFGPSGTGRLGDLQITAPVFANLPASSGDQIIVPKSWTATYTHHLRKVTLYGELIIPATI